MDHFIDNIVFLQDKMFLKEELEAAIGDLPDNYYTFRRKLREDYNPQISEINQKILNIKGEIGDLKIALVETGVDVGPAIYLARTFNTDIDSVVKFFILILIFVFDPMAIMFVISYNVILLDRKKIGYKTDSNITVKKRKWRLWPVYGEKKKKEPEVVIEEHVDTKEETSKNDDSDSKNNEKKIPGEFRRKPGK